jgi:hypothetical protein
MGSSTLAVLLMAGAEAGAWSYVGWFLGTDQWRPVGAILIGLIAFTLVWILDSTLLTLDATKAEYKERLERLERLGGRPSPLRHRPGRLIKIVRSGGVGVLARVAMVAGSLYVSAPYLTQLVFRQDIAAVLQRQDTEKIASARKQVDALFDAHARELAQREIDLRQDLIREAAGKGPSGRFGRGPTVQTMEARLKEIQAQIALADRQRASELLAFDRLTPAELTRKYGILFQSGGIQARSSVMEIVKKQPGYRVTEWTVRAFMFGLFLAILILKLFQPHSVEIYYSEACQDCYARYLTGEFDAMLPEKERFSAGGAITPLRFNEWFRSDYVTYADQTHAMSEMGSIHTRHHAEEENLKAVESAARKDLSPLLTDYDTVMSEAAQIETELISVKSELESVDEEISAHRRSIDALSSSIKYPRAVGAEEFLYVLDTKKEWTSGLKDFEDRKRTLAVKQKTLERQLATRRTAAERIQSNIDARSGVLKDANARIVEARKRTLDALNRVNARHE